MKIKYLLTALLIIHSFISAAQSIKRDTVFLLKEKRATSYHAVFIDNNPKSEYYKGISDFRVTENDKSIYESTLKGFRGQRLKKFKDKTFPREWIRIFQYKGRFYAYSPSDYYFGDYRVRLTDSTYIDYIGEGPVASKIIFFNRVDSVTYRLQLTEKTYYPNRKLTVHMIDPQRGIAIFEENVDGRGSDYFPMVRADKLRGLPLIVNYSPDQKEQEFDFKEPDYRKLLQKKLQKDTVKQVSSVNKIK